MPARSSDPVPFSDLLRISLSPLCRWSSERVLAHPYFWTEELYAHFYWWANGRKSVCCVGVEGTSVVLDAQGTGH